MIDRRSFLRRSAAAAGALWLPVPARAAQAVLEAPTAPRATWLLAGWTYRNSRGAPAEIRLTYRGETIEVHTVGPQSSFLSQPLHAHPFELGELVLEERHHTAEGIVAGRAVIVAGGDSDDWPFVTVAVRA